MCHYLFIQPPLVGCPGCLLQWTPDLDLQNWAPTEGTRTGISLTCVLSLISGSMALLIYRLSTRGMENSYQAGNLQGVILIQVRQAALESSCLSCTMNVCLAAVWK